MGRTKNIQSLERAFSILELFEDNNSLMSVKEISDTLELSKSTVFGLINTLFNLGYLRQDKETLKYNLGSKVLALGNAVSSSDIIAKTAHEFMQSVSDRFQETCLIVVEENDWVLYIDKTESSSSITIKTRIGTKKEMYCTGVGKVFLSFMDEERVDEILSKEMEKKTENTITDKTKLKKEFELIRKRGYATDNEEFEMGISCIAVPIFNRNGQIISAISLTGPVFRVKKLDMEEVANALKEAAASISEKLMI